MWKIHRPILMATQGQYPASNVLGLWSNNEMLLRERQWTRSGELVTSNCLKVGFYLGSCFTTKRAGRVFRSANLGHNHVAAAIKDAEQVLAC
jgi:hypothetical protein